MAHHEVLAYAKSWPQVYLDMPLCQNRCEDRQKTQNTVG